MTMFSLRKVLDICGAGKYPIISGQINPICFVPDWLHQIIFSAPKHVWKTFERVIIAMFTTRATVPLGLMVTIVYLVRKLDPKDLGNLLREVVNSNWFAILGWLLFIILMPVAVLAFNYREKIYQNELNRLQQVKDRAVQNQLEIKFPRT